MKDSIIQFDKERRFHTMKLANRIFLFFCALSVISFVQFNAIAVNDCAIAPKAGKYCQKPNNKPDCPKGCWCEGQATYHLEGRVSQDRVAEICRNKDASVYELRQLHYAKVYVCGIDYNSIPYGEQDPHGFAGTGITGTTVLKSYSDPKAENSSKCKANRAQVSSGSGWLYDGNAKKGCPPGCFCSGSNVRVDLDYAKVRDACLHLSSNKINGFDIKTYLEERGVNYCPQGYTYASIGAENINQCKNSDLQNYVAPSGGDTPCQPGEYLNTVAGSLTLLNTTAGNLRPSLKAPRCVQCEAGYYCPDGINREPCSGSFQYSRAGQAACSTCSGGRRANSDHTGCVLVLPTSEEVARQRIEPNNLVDPEAICLNGPSHKVYFLRGAGNADGTMNPVNKCTGNTVTLPNSNFTRAGYQFDEWNCDHDIGTKAAGATFPMPNADVNCTAQWTLVPAGTYTVQYTCGEGTGSVPIDMNSPYISGRTAIALANTCTAPNGKTFSGWLCGNTSVGPGGSFTITANTTCVAQWTDGTGGSAGGGTGGSAGGEPETPVSCTTAGKYWDGDGCITCESSYFCPGNGQHYKCPFGGASTQNKASCVLNLNETQMEYNKCWLRYWNNAAAYRKCLYGIDLATLPH